MQTATGSEAEDGTPAGSPWRRLAIALAVAGVYGVAKLAAGRWDGELADAAWVPAQGSELRPLVQLALGGTLVAAAVALVGWWALSRARLLPPPGRSFTLGRSLRTTVLVGLAVSAAAVAYTLLFAWAAGISFRFAATSTPKSRAALSPKICALTAGVSGG